MSDLCLEKIKNMLLAHNDGGYRLETRENLYDIISYLVMEVELNDAAIDLCRTALDTCEMALCTVQHAQESGAKWYTHGDMALYQNVRMHTKNGREAIKKAREII